MFVSGEDWHMCLCEKVASLLGWKTKTKSRKQFPKNASTTEVQMYFYGVVQERKYLWDPLFAGKIMKKRMNVYHSAISIVLFLPFSINIFILMSAGWSKTGITPVLDRAEPVQRRISWHVSPVHGWFSLLCVCANGERVVLSVWAAYPISVPAST